MKLKTTRGYTLIEMGIVLVILALLVAGLAVPLVTQIQNQRIATAQQQAQDIRAALIGYAIAAGRFPCPDRTTGGGANDGLEDVSAATPGAACSVLSGNVAIGNVPWATLGLPATDPWGNRWRYVVWAPYAARLSTGSRANFTLEQLSGANSPSGAVPSALRVCTTAAGCPNVVALGAAVPGELGRNLPAIILSHGSNGFGAQNSSGNTNVAPVGADEVRNQGLGANPNSYVSRPQTQSNATGGEFDDQASWVVPAVLVDQSVRAGLLP